MEKNLSEFYRDNKTKDKHTGECMMCMTNYRKSRRKEAIVYGKKYREENREKIVKRKREAWSMLNPERKMYTQARNRAKRNGLDFNIEVSDIIVPEYCPLLGIKLFPGTKDNYRSSPSLDRIDPTKGYIKGNVNVISSIANTMKSNATKQELLTFANNIIKVYSDDIVRTHA